MNEEILDANAIDGLDDFDLTGDYENPEDLTQNDQNSEQNQDENDNNDLETVDTNVHNDSEENSDDFINKVLQLKGIEDSSKIKFEDESGAIVEKSWNDLSENEKLSILTLEEDTDTDLEDEEADFINMLRIHNLTPSQYIKLLQDNIIKNYQDNQPVNYEIDNLDDDELFAFDLLEKLGDDNITDEEIQEAITLAKTNEVFYKKQIEALRVYYKDLEDKRRFEQELSLAEAAENSYKEFSEQILNLIEGLNSVAGQEIDLNIDAKNDIANYILTRDDNGESDFYKDLQNPQTLTMAAFWMLKGPEIMQELEMQILEAYKRGFVFGSAQSKNVQTPKSLVVIAPKLTTYVQKNNDASAAFGDDESYLYN